MNRKLLDRAVALAVIVLFSFSICILSLPVRTGSSPPRPARLTVSSPLSVDQLSTEELFKALLVHDSLLHTSQATTPPTTPHVTGLLSPGSSTPRPGWSYYKLPAFLDYPILSPRSHLVTFDSSKPAVLLPLDPHETFSWIKSFTFNRFYSRLDSNHALTVKQTGSEPSWLDRVQSSTKRATLQQVAKEGLRAKIKAAEWAESIKREGGRGDGWWDGEMVGRSLERTWSMWLRGLSEASGYDYIPVEQITSKIQR
ncbi:alpha-1,2 mannosyltransferase [Pseudozyma hubeiensis SY62]|uniref:Alpha-1,2 mannosyltransferase n=1 Tax=Pseudozyma hubeiensis (strain SY62) TaxID=1305764 RepID=R9P0Q7_PSEHS|nr:alpha-1,2 mannosyltransferase [Pseudozyma hubeiensis SY62]GAC94746.1 alpha-1,2 mannosyltransferase [Pseudozyma hubeiensis SY62]